MGSVPCARSRSGSPRRILDFTANVILPDQGVARREFCTRVGVVVANNGRICHWVVIEVVHVGRSAAPLLVHASVRAAVRILSASFTDSVPRS